MSALQLYSNAVFKIPLTYQKMLDIRHSPTDQVLANLQELFHRPEIPFETKCSMSLTYDIGDIGEACRNLHKHLNVSLIQCTNAV